VPRAKGALHLFSVPSERGGANLGEALIGEHGGGSCAILLVVAINARSSPGRSVPLPPRGRKMILQARSSLLRKEERTMSVRSGVPGACLLAVLLLVLPTAAAEEKENPILTFVKSKVKDPDKPFTLLITLKVKEGEEKKLEEVFAKAVKPTRKEKGC